jgi:hypothetical protein
MTKKKNTSLIGLLRVLNSKFPSFVEEKDLAEYQDILHLSLGIIAPPSKGTQSSDINYLAKVAMVQSTNFIELLNAVPSKKIPNRYRITLKGIELHNHKGFALINP